jgi:predicted membrane protein
MVGIHARGHARRKKFMTTTTSSTSWKTWSTSTRVFVAAGAIAAVCVVVFLYTT